MKRKPLIPAVELFERFSTFDDVHMPNTILHMKYSEASLLIGLIKNMIIRADSKVIRKCFQGTPWAHGELVLGAAQGRP